MIGTLSAGSVLNADGNDVMEIGDLPFIWEVDNRDAFKINGRTHSKIGNYEASYLCNKIKYWVTEERKLPSGNKYYLPTAMLHRRMLEIRIRSKIFSDFMQWIENYNSYIFNAWE